jgi:hypothetical protein
MSRTQIAHFSSACCPISWAFWFEEGAFVLLHEVHIMWNVGKTVVRKSV